MNLTDLPDELLTKIFHMTVEENHKSHISAALPLSSEATALAHACRKFRSIYVSNCLYILDFQNCLPSSIPWIRQLSLCRIAGPYLRVVRFAEHDKRNNRLNAESPPNFCPFQPVLFDTLSLYCRQVRELDLRFVSTKHLRNCAVAFRRMLHCCKLISALDLGVVTPDMLNVLVSSLRPRKAGTTACLQNLKRLGMHNFRCTFGDLHKLLWALQSRSLDALTLSGCLTDYPADLSLFNPIRHGQRSVSASTEIIHGIAEPTLGPFSISQRGKNLLSHCYLREYLQLNDVDTIDLSSLDLQSNSHFVLDAALASPHAFAIESHSLLTHNTRLLDVT